MARNHKTNSHIFSPLLKLFKKITPDREIILRKELDYLSGAETRLENPDALITEKGKDLTLYDTMLLDDVIYSTIELKKKMVLSIPWNIVPATDEEQDIEKADFVKDVLCNLQISFDDHLDNLLDAMIYGNKVAEKIWDVRGGKWVWKNLLHKHSKYYDYDYDEYGFLDKLVIGRDYGWTKEIQGIDEINNKFIVFSYPYPVDGNWYGESDLMSIYTQYHQKYYAYRWRGQFLQGYGMPVPVVKYVKNEVSSTEYSDFTSMLDNWQDNMYIMLPSLRDMKTGELHSKFEIEFREVNKGGKETPYDNVISQLNNDIRRKLLLPDKLGFSDSPGGSYSLGETQFDILKMIIKDNHTKLENIFKPHIRQLVDYNFAGTKEYPVFEFADINSKLESDLLRLLFDYSVVDPAEKWLRGRLSIPEITEKEKDQLEKMREEEKARKIKEQEIMMAAGAVEETEEDEKSEMKRGSVFDAENAKRIYDRNEEWFLSEYATAYRKAMDELISQVKRKNIVEDKALKRIDELRIKKADIKKLLTSYYNKLYVEGKEAAIKEIRPRLKKAMGSDYLKMKGEMVEIPDEWLDREYIRRTLSAYGELGILTTADIQYLRQLADQAFYITGDIEHRMVKNVYQAVKESVDAGETIGTAIRRIEGYLGDDLKKYAGTIARTNASDAFNTSRMNLFTSPQVSKFIEAYQYLAIIDDRTSEFCQAHDTQIIKASDPLVSLINPPAHFNCRSVLVPIMVGEGELEGSEFYGYEANWNEDVPAAEQMPSKGFGG